MDTFKLETRSPEETLRLGQRLAQCLKGGEIICLSGNLGSGKTTLVKGIARGLKIEEKKVNSPTFVLMNTYEGKLPLHHFDFYRLGDPKEIAGIGYDEFLYGNGVAVVEWAERFGSLMPPENLEIRLTDAGDDKRILNFIAHGAKYQQIVVKLFSSTQRLVPRS